MSSVTIQQKGITAIAADAIVNAANSALWAGGGVCGAIFRKAGMAELTVACNAIGHCDEGSAVITPGFSCPCKYIIHAVGPQYIDGKHGEADALYGAYKSSLELCRKNDIHSVVFPLISAGIFGYPLRDAWKQAIYACKNFINKNQDYDLNIIFAIPEAEKVKAGTEILHKELPNIAKMEAYAKSFDQSNLMVVAPTVRKFADRYSIDTLLSSYDNKNPPKCVCFWHENEENGIFSQWYKTCFKFNGREYVTAEQYMMSEKALLFEDFDSYKKIMEEDDPQKCKGLGRGVKNFDPKKWNENFREIIFMGNFLKAQYDINFLDALLQTEDALLIEASPYDDTYGAGLEAKDLVDKNGFLKTQPKEWQKEDCTKQAQNNLGFVLMGLRDFYREFLGKK